MKKFIFGKTPKPAKSLIVIGAGIILISLPVAVLADYRDFVIFLGILSVGVGVLSVLVATRFRNLFISQEEVAQIHETKQETPLKLPLPKLSATGILLLIIIEGFLLNQFLVWRLNH